MPLPYKRGFIFFLAAPLALLILASSARADEIRLKDGTKLYGVIVGYEDNMFRVKTDYGFQLVEKDKIASIVPSAQGAKPETDAAVKPDAAAKPDAATKRDPASRPAKSAASAQPQPSPAVVASANTAASGGPVNASAKTADPAPAAKSDKAPAKPANAAAVKPAAANAAPATSASAAPAASSAAPSATAGTPAADSASAAPKEPELPANREEVSGNLYTNYTHGFRMYKAPSWNLIEEARGALPNAIVALGTNDESTLIVVGEEKTKDSLDAAAAAVEKRLHDVYVNYQRVSQRKTTIGGMPAVDYQYHGKADDHDWSGRLVVIARGRDMLTVLAMTYADSDLIQIQENVISRSIASLDFSVH